MFRIIVIASVLSVVCGTKFAYYGNSVMDYHRGSGRVVSLPYPYQEPNVVKIQPQTDLETVYEVRNAVVPVETTEDYSPYELICLISTSIFSCIRRAIMHVITSLPTLIFSFFGICNMTSLCNNFSANSLLGIRDLTAFVTPERLKRAAEFVQSAINQYRSLQE